MRITCETKDTLPLSALTEFQGGLKKRTAEDTKKIEKSINGWLITLIIVGVLVLAGGVTVFILKRKEII